MNERAWVATPAHRRALTVAAVGLLVGLLARRPDLVVLSTPFLVMTVWAVRFRPASEPTLSTQVSPTTLHEGGTATWFTQASLPPGAEDLVLLVDPPPFVECDPPSGVVCSSGPTAAASRTVSLRLPLRSLRWGERAIGPGIVVATSPFGAFRWTPGQLPAVRTVTLPAKEPFTSRTSMPHPIGIVGHNTSTRPGQGTEFAAIRPYASGDRLKRINWPVSLRTGSLNVTATYADQDTQVLLVVDAFHDIGRSEPGAETGAGAGAGTSALDTRSSSSLDTSVRAAAALAEHYLQHGERVGLVVLGSGGVAPLSAGAGRGQLRRVLDSLARIQPGTQIYRDEKRTAAGLLSRVPAGAVLLVLTPAISDTALTRAATLARRGLGVVVVDTLPAAATAARLSVADLFAIAPLRRVRDVAPTRLAWRLRLLERDGQLRRLREQGLPVVRWTGPGSLDDVLRQLRRRARAPRMVRR